MSVDRNAPHAAAFYIAAIVTQIEATPGIERLRSLTDGSALADRATVEATLTEAARFTATYLTPLNARLDADGCVLREGRVQTIPAHRAAWEAFVDGGWSTLDHPRELGGQGLPLFLAAAVQQVFDSGCAAFGMLPVVQRSAARLLTAYGDAWMKAEWLPKLVRGEWGATICISEADAGSDVGRIRTRAEPAAGGGWSITGEKMWISFGDHDLTPRIGHCLLARTGGAGSSGALSLFFVPDVLVGPHGKHTRNSIVVRRLEAKMGLHGSPTCALGFEGAQGWLIGTAGRGLAQMFVMITNMRLSAGIQGLGLAAAAADVALAYAAERRQGGPSGAAPVPISHHADVQHQLLSMVARVEVLRGLAFAIAVQADLASHESTPEARDTAAALTQWLLPIFKTTGGEFGFDVASGAIQVLGGAGYTREWLVEQALRDARIITIYEGTTGIQALDLLQRRLWRDAGRGLTVFLANARADIGGLGAPDTGPARCFDLLEDAARHLTALHSAPRQAEAGATAFLHLAALAATGWIAARLAAGGVESPISRRLSAAGRYWLCHLAEHAALTHGQVCSGAAPLELFKLL
jgi:alkylation response protein AidB-like acyl-CoA dehydrogenase